MTTPGFTGTSAVCFLTPAHAARLQQLVGEARDEGDARFAELAVEGGMERFVARSVEEREAGRAYTFAITERGDALGFCALRGLTDAAGPTVECWVAPPFRGKGYGTFGVGKVLELAFQNLQLEQVFARPAGQALKRLLERQGFAPDEGGDGRGALALTRARWIERRDAPALAKLHPLLRALLDAELAAGNEVAETGGGWPDADSVFVRLKHPFRARPSSLPHGVVYTEPNDPHWWKADYSTLSPRHLLAC